MPEGGQSRRRVQVSQLPASACVACDRASAVTGFTKQWFLFFTWEECLFPVTRETYTELLQCPWHISPTELNSENTNKFHLCPPPPLTSRALQQPARPLSLVPRT